MRNLLISLTFILALIIGSSTDAYSQNRGGKIVDVFTLHFGSGDFINLDAIPKIAVEIASEENAPSLIMREYDYDSISNNGIPIPADIDNQLDGRYYVRVYFNGVLLKGEYVEF